VSASIIASLLVGAVLALRFKVFILVPTILAAWAVLTGIGLAWEITAAWIRDARHWKWGDTVSHNGRSMKQADSIPRCGRTNRVRRHCGGFTAMELMIVLVMLGVLAAFGYPRLAREMRQA